MARSRTKQGNRKRRVKQYVIVDGERRVLRDKRGRPITIAADDSGQTLWEIRERHQSQAAFWQSVRDEREAKRQLEEEAAAAELVGP